MTQATSDSDGGPRYGDRATGPWNDRVRFASDGRGGKYAYKPSEVLLGAGTRSEEARALAQTLNGPSGGDRGGRPNLVAARELGPFVVLSNLLDTELAVRLLRGNGLVAQPNHVFFAHADGCCQPPCPPHPAFRCAGGYGPGPVPGPPGPPIPAPTPTSTHGSPVYGSPVYGSPVYGSPVYGSPVYGSPVYGSPVYGSPVYGSPVYGSPVYGSPVYGSPEYTATGKRRSSARPATLDDMIGVLAESSNAPDAVGGPTVIILDTGLAQPGNRPDSLNPNRITAAGSDTDAPDEDEDRDLDPAAGHGTFIAGVIDHIQPGCSITLFRVLTTYGDGDEAAIAAVLRELTIDDPEHTIINLSFGAYVLENPIVLEWAIRTLQDKGVVFVASAGNDGTCSPQYPAAFSGVVSVGAIGPSGPAPFSNYGPWVRACAPGVDILSTFFTNFNGRATAGASGTDPDLFQGWAIWSGTSFSGPAVVGALAKEMVSVGCTAKEAVERIVDAPSLMRIPDLGTVVNVT